MVKTPGVIIKPIEYEDVDPYEKGGDNKHSARKQKKNTKGKRKGEIKGKTKGANS